MNFNLIQKRENPNASPLYRLRTSKKVMRKPSHGTIEIPSKCGLNALYGTTMNKEKPNILYIRTRTKVGPIPGATLGTAKEIEGIRSQITAMFQDVAKSTPHFDDRILTSLDYSAKNLAAGKTVFLRYDIHIRPTKLDTIPMQYSRVVRLASTVERRLLEILKKVGLRTIKEENK